MCGRMALTLPHEAMVQMFDAVPANDLPEVPNYNVCPTVQIPVVTAQDSMRQLRPMRWGFIPSWYKKPNGGPLLINARAETIAEKPAFRAACRERRCLLPITGFYEWERDGDAKPLCAACDGGDLADVGARRRSVHILRHCHHRSEQGDGAYPPPHSSHPNVRAMGAMVRRRRKRRRYIDEKRTRGCAFISSCQHGD